MSANVVCSTINAVPKKAARRDPPPKELRALPSRITFLRERADMTQARLAEKLGLTPAQVSRIESGQRLIDLETLIKLSRILGAPVGWIAAEEGNLPPTPVFDEDLSDRRRRRSKPESSSSK